MGSNNKSFGTALIVDDSATMRNTLKAILEFSNIDVIGQLADGSELLKTISQAHPDIVCLDYNLPDINGLDLLKSIASEYPAVAVVMITGEANPTLKIIAAESGAAGFIQKPFSEVQIAQEIKHILYTKHCISRTAKSSMKNGDSDESVTTKGTAIIADDSMTMRQLLRAILVDMRIDVVAEASNGEKAVELAAQYQPDLICLDIDMPSLDGLAALKKITNENHSIKALMITGNAQRGAVVEAFQLGACGFVVKPFEPVKVTDAVKKALNF